MKLLQRSAGKSVSQIFVVLLLELFLNMRFFLSAHVALPFHQKVVGRFKDVRFHPIFNFCHFGSVYFLWLKPLLFKPLLLTRRGQVWFLTGFDLFQFVRTASNAAPWMKSFGGALWLDPGSSWATSKIRAMALAKEGNLSDVPQPRGRQRQPRPLKDGRVPRPANPDEAVKAARVRVTRLESALAA